MRFGGFDITIERYHKIKINDTDSGLIEEQSVQAILLYFILIELRETNERLHEMYDKLNKE